MEEERRLALEVLEGFPPPAFVVVVTLEIAAANPIQWVSDLLPKGEDGQANRSRRVALVENAEGVEESRE